MVYLNQYSFFTMLVVLLNKLPADLFHVSDLDSFYRGIQYSSTIGLFTVKIKDNPKLFQHRTSKSM